MYSVLIVDDEPMIGKGLSHLLQQSGLDIVKVHTALNGYEALDYIRMEELDLIITDIQMGEMSGIELMHQAKIVKPWLPIIIISAHEDFHYAQLALRLGAKDYLVKPLNDGYFLDVVRNTLLKARKAAPAKQEVTSSLDPAFAMRAPQQESTRMLNRLLAADAGESDAGAAIDLLSAKFGIDLAGPYYSVIRICLKPKTDGACGAETGEWTDNEPVYYAALNVVCESLNKWRHVSFYSPGNSITCILMWSEADDREPKIDKLNELDMVGRTLHFNIEHVLNLDCLVGISQILHGARFLPELNRQAGEALKWRHIHKEHNIFYYGDFNPNLYSEHKSLDEINELNNDIVEQAKAYLDANFAQKGLTLQEVAQKIHVSPNYLSYLFKKYTDCNLWEYVIKLRMEAGKRLLLTTDMRRYEISEQVGYESPEHFSKIFKKYFGLSPSEMKK